MLDRAVNLHEPLKNFLRQDVLEHVPRAASFALLNKIIA